MSNWMIALFFGAGVAGWTYTKLIRSNGNAIPSQNYSGAAIAGAATFILIFTLLKFVFHF